MNPEQVLRDGVTLLEEALRPHGFRFVAGSSGVGSGGHFASGAFVKGGRKLELHFRHSLGLVTYHLGEATLAHEEYMRAAGAGSERRYPGFSADPLQAFRDLKYDLEHHGMAFMTGSDADFEACVSWAARNPLPSGISRLSSGGAA